jgi:3'-phosphoadenosine 5'-phosphosulfate sulfotransferase (PAPS reductase)/FAD synthetase
VTNHYTLPDGNVQISFSGGRTSGYMLHQIAEANGGIPDRCKVVFANTGREMPQTLDFVQECGDRWGIPITWVEDAKRNGEGLFDIVSHSTASRDGEPFSQLIDRKKSCPDQSKRFCTEHLKILPARRYLIALGWKQWTNTVGIRADEAHRLKPSIDKRVTRWFPLADAGVSKADVIAFWAGQPFDLMVPAGFGNCDGCFLKSEATLAALSRDYPERSAWWEAQEAKVGGTFRKDFSRSQLRSFVEKQGDWIFDTEDALCQKDGGECTE